MQNTYQFRQDQSELLCIPNCSPKEYSDFLFIDINPSGNKSYEKQITQNRGGKDRETLSDIAQEYNIYKDF